jgi:hypothetical protein
MSDQSDGNGLAGKRSRKWVSLVPYGLHEQHPNAFKDIAETIWENRDQLGFAWRILNNGCCDGCSLGTTGMHDQPAPDRRRRGPGQIIKEASVEPGPAARSDDPPPGRERLPANLMG